MKKVIIFFLSFYYSAFVPLSALVLKNDTKNIIHIISLMDAQGSEFHTIPNILQPWQIVQIPNFSYQNGQLKQACLQHLTVTTQADAQKQVFMVNMLAKDLPGIYNETAGLTFGIPVTRKVQRRYYKLQEKFPNQLNVRLQNVTSMEKC